MEPIYNSVSIKSRDGTVLFTARNLTIQDALNGYSAKYEFASSETLIKAIQEIVVW